MERRIPPPHTSSHSVVFAPQFSRLWRSPLGASICVCYSTQWRCKDIWRRPGTNIPIPNSRNVKKSIGNRPNSGSIKKINVKNLGANGRAFLAQDRIVDERRGSPSPKVPPPYRFAFCQASQQASRSVSALRGRIAQSVTLSDSVSVSWYTTSSCSLLVLLLADSIALVSLVESGSGPVSYTHLTLPTIYSV